MVNLWSRNKGGTSILKSAQSNGIQPIKEVEHLIQKKASFGNISASGFPREDSR